MDPIGLLLVVGGLALVIGGLVFRLPSTRARSFEQAKTAESLETINRYLDEIRRQGNDYAERLPDDRGTPGERRQIGIAAHVAAPAGHAR